MTLIIDSDKSRSAGSLFYHYLYLNDHNVYINLPSYENQIAQDNIVDNFGIFKQLKKFHDVGAERYVDEEEL